MAVDIRILQRTFAGTAPQAEKEEDIGFRARVGNLEYDVLKNEKADRDLLQKIGDWTKTTNGFFRFTLTADKALREAKECGYSSPETEKLSSQFRTAWQMSAIPHVFDSTHIAREAIQEASKPEILPGQIGRRITKAVQESFAAMANFAYAITAVAGCFAKTGELSKSAADLGEHASAIDDTAVFVMGIQDLNRALSERGAAETAGAPIRLRNALVYTARYSLLKVAKATCSVASYVFTTAARLTGKALVSPLTAATCSLASSVFAIWSHFYKEGMQDKPIDFYDGKHVRLLPRPAA